MSDLPEQEVWVEQGCSWLDVRGSDFDAALLIKGQPFLYHWSDCQGSVAQQLVYASLPDPSHAIQRFRTALSEPLDTNRNLANCLIDVLPLLAPGAYRLKLCDAAEYDIVDFHSAWNPNKDCSHYYPGCGSFVFTQPIDSLRGERIEHYKARIVSGDRPSVLTITVEGGWSDFVIDGHHRLTAYLDAHVPVRFLSICRLNPPRISLAEQQQWIPAPHPERITALRVKTKFDTLSR